MNHENSVVPMQKFINTCPSIYDILVAIKGCLLFVDIISIVTLDIEDFVLHKIILMLVGGLAGNGWDGGRL